MLMNKEQSGSHKNIHKDQEDQKEDCTTCAAICLSVGPLGEHLHKDRSKLQYTSFLSLNVLPPSGLTTLVIVCISKVWESAISQEELFSSRPSFLNTLTSLSYNIQDSNP